VRSSTDLVWFRKFVKRGLLVARTEIVLVSENDNSCLMVGEGEKTVDAELVEVGHITENIGVLVRDL